MTPDDVDKSLQVLILSIGDEEEKEEKYRSLKANAKKAREKVPAKNWDAEFRAAIDDIRSANNLKPNIYEAREAVIKTLHDAGVPGYGPEPED